MPSSHLTRVVFRSFIANKPLLYRGCVYRTPRPRFTLHHGCQTLPQPQRRAFFDLLKPQRKAKSAEIPAGLDKLGELMQMQHNHTRLPPTSEIADAIRTFFAQKNMVFEDSHSTLAYNAFKYLQENPREDETPWLSQKDLHQIILRLAQPSKTGGKAHLALAKAIHQELVHQQETKEDATSKNAISPFISSSIRYLHILAMYGASAEARELAVDKFSSPITSKTDFPDFKTITYAWTNVLQGFARESNRDELLHSVELLQQLQVPFSRSMQGVLVDYFIQQGDWELAKQWYNRPVTNSKGVTEFNPNGTTHSSILKGSAFKGDLSFGQEAVASLLKSNPSKEAWDAIFVWSAAIGKGVDEVHRMMNVMVRRNDDLRQKDPTQPIVHPDIDTINALVEFSISKNDPYSAERYITLGEKWNILPNSKTFVLQMQYRLSAKDIDGAKTAYYGLEGAKDEETVLVVNQLIQAMCRTKHHFDDIMVIVDDLHEKKSRLEPETIADLCVLHLRRAEVHDAIDLLQVHAYRYSAEQRRTIRDQLLLFLLDRQNSTADAWDTYQILRNIFVETSRDIRINIMNEFFARGRSDMACHVFFHMRNTTHESICATKEVYVNAFVGFARNADAESLELAHNQLKLDLTVETDTELRNALMLAQAATGNNRRALETWAEIGASKEGPSYNSIAIAFRCCEGMSWGDQYAKPIWRRLKEMGVDIDRQIFTAYLGALARNQQHSEVVSMLETVEADYGFQPDFFILSNWFNTTTNIERQKTVEAWIRERYPDVWTEFEKVGFWTTMDGFGYRQLNIKRDLEP